MSPLIDFSKETLSHDLLLTMFFSRNLGDFYLYLYGEDATKIKGKKLRRIDLVRYDVTSLEDVGPGFSTYAYELAEMFLKRRGEIKLILVEPNEKIRRFHQTYVDSGFESAKSYFENEFGKRLLPKLYVLAQIDPTKMDVRVVDGRVEEKILPADMVIASFVLKYLKNLRNLRRAIQNIYTSSKVVGITVGIRDSIDWGVSGLLRKRCMVYSDEDGYGMDLTEFLESLKKATGKHYTLFFSHSKEVVPDLLNPRYVWDNLNLLVYSDT